MGMDRYGRLLGAVEVREAPSDHFCRLFLSAPVRINFLKWGFLTISNQSFLKTRFLTDWKSTVRVFRMVLRDEGSKP